MIKRLLTLTIATLIFSGSIFAADMKVGVVRLQDIIAKAPQRETLMLGVQEKFKERANSLKELDDEIKAKAEKGNKDRMTMTQEDAVKLSRELEFKQAELQLKDKAFKEDYKTAVDQENRKLLQLANKAINQVAMNEKYDMVVSAEVVVFAIPGNDLTDKVIALLTDPSFK